MLILKYVLYILEKQAGNRRENYENKLAITKTLLHFIMADKVTGDNIYKALIYFEDFYDKMDESEH